MTNLASLVTFSQELTEEIFEISVMQPLFPKIFDGLAFTIYENRLSHAQMQTVGLL